MTEPDVCPELIRMLRAQRHDFINHIQVVHAFLQLGRTEKALAYIEDISRGEGLLTETLRLHRETPDCRRQAER